MTITTETMTAIASSPSTIRRVADKRKASELTAEDKRTFLALIYEGKKPEDAARIAGSTATQFRRLRNPQGDHFDAAFTADYERALASDEHRQGFLEELRAAIWGEAQKGNARLLEKLAFIYDPDWEPLRSTNFNMNLNVQMVARVLPYLPQEALEEAIRQAESELKPARRELPRAAA